MASNREQTPNRDLHSSYYLKCHKEDTKPDALYALDTDTEMHTHKERYSSS